MNWKNWPYWLKGGWMLSVINLGLIIISYILPSPMFSFKFGYFTIGDLFSFPALLMWEGSQEIFSLVINRPLQYLFIILISSIEYFIIGALIGWIYGKIKSKKYK